MKEKKAFNAVSPMIATVLLVAVALAIAGILYSWSQTYLTRETVQVSEVTSMQVNCSYANIEIQDCKYSQTSGLSFILNSVGSIDLAKGFKLSVLSADETKAESSLATTLEGGNFQAINSADLANARDYINLATPLKRVRITPEECPEKYAETTKCS